MKPQKTSQQRTYLAPGMRVRPLALEKQFCASNLDDMHYIDGSWDDDGNN